MNNYRLQSKYPISYKHLEEALEIYAVDHELKGFKYQTDTGKYKYNAIACHVIEFCNNTFSYEPNNMERIVHYLQGLGLSIPFTNYDIQQIAYKQGQLKETDADNKHIKVTNGYWSFMAMRLTNIASSKN